MRVREARAAHAALVDERVQVPALDVVCAPAPRLRDERDLLVVELGERARVPRAVDDDLVPGEGGIEIRDDADAPARAVARLARGKCQRLRRRPPLTPLAERA
jgi:hypothetical protein